MLGNLRSAQTLLYGLANRNSDALVNLQQEEERLYLEPSLKIKS
ncbi:hypothetical protein ACVWYG_000036 [Pedobacter sp. UYEF25]